MVETILWALIGGTIIGILGQAFAPGHRQVPLWLTILCGIGGVFLGNWLYVDVFDFTPTPSAWTGGGTPGRSRWRRSSWSSRRPSPAAAARRPSRS